MCNPIVKLPIFVKKCDMGILYFFRTPKPRQFRYKPIYYDQRKEELKEREARIRQEMGLGSDEARYVSNIKGQFQRKRGQIQQNRAKANKRLLIIVVILAILAYFMFYR